VLVSHPRSLWAEPGVEQLTLRTEHRGSLHSWREACSKWHLSVSEIILSHQYERREHVLPFRYLSALVWLTWTMKRLVIRGKSHSSSSHPEWQGLSPWTA
jgi:hypothetical protein